MMASGLPVVELDGRQRRLGARRHRASVAMLVEPRPDAIADALGRMLDEPEEAAAMARRARAFVEGRTWERAGDQVEAALHSFLATPTRPAGPSAAGSGGAPPQEPAAEAGDEQHAAAESGRVGRA